MKALKTIVGHWSARQLLPAAAASLLVGFFLVPRLAGAGAAAGPAVGQAKPTTNAPLVVKSVFVDDPKSGRDPFFPQSRRREAEAASTGQRAPVLAALPAGLVLKGISGPPSRRLAIINNHTFAVGEMAQIKVDGQLFKIQCVEVRDRSALVKCNDSPPKELPLRKGT